MSLREEKLGKFAIRDFSQEVTEPGKFITEDDIRKVEQLDFERKMLVAEQKKQEELWKDKVMGPFGHYILIKPTDENPYLRKVSDSGIITDTGGIHANPDSGKNDLLTRGIAYAVIEQVGPDVKHARKGDEIIYSPERKLPMPFKGEGYCLINEGYILSFVGKAKDLEERFKLLNYGD